MRRLWTVAIVVALAGLIFAQGATAIPKKAVPKKAEQPSQTAEKQYNAKITFDEESFNFGFVPQGNTKLIHKFHLKNTGTDTLRITRVRPTCGCTAAPLEKKVLAPGEETYIKVIFRTRGYKRRTTKAVKVMSNDPNRPIVSLRFTANFDTTRWNDVSKGPRIKQDPLILDLGKGKDFKSKATVVIRNLSDKKLTLKVVDYTDDVLKEVKLKKTTLKGNGKVKLQVKVRDDYDINKPVQASITIAAYDKSGSEVTRITIPVVGGGK